MAEIQMPQMGESIAEGTLTKWFKKPGDRVKRDEPLFEISTDKVDAEIPSPSDGVLEKIIVPEGTTVAVNTVVGILGAVGSSSGGSAAASAPTATPSAGATPPKFSVSNPTTPSAKPVASASPSSNGDGKSSPSAVATAADAAKVRSSPLVRRLARENGIEDLALISGSGAGGRVTKQDILSFIASGRMAAAPSAARGPAPTSTHGPAHAAGAFPVLNLPRTGARTEKLTVMRRKIGEHMVQSRRVSAHVHSVFEIDVHHLAKLRESRKAAFEARHGVKLTFTPFFMRAVVGALIKHPYVNASIDGEEIVLHNAVHLGVAVALEGGLIVPVVKNAQDLTLVGLQKRVTDLATRARSKQLTPDEVQGGTFTITNPGAFGNEFGIPIINQPQVAILGIGGIKKRAVVVEGDAIAVRNTVFMCLSYDHRLVDGALGDQFMNTVKATLESWDEPVE